MSKSTIPDRSPRSPVVVLFLLLSACFQQVPPESAAFDSSSVQLIDIDSTGVQIVAVDSSGVQIVTSDPMNSDATCRISEEPILVIGDDEEDKNHFFTLVRGVGRLSDGSVAVVDRRAAEVRVFDKTGQHLRSMGRSGEAPGEFLNPFFLWITAGDTLWAGDYRPWRYNVFTSQGDFVRRVSLTPVYPNPSRRGGVLDNGYTVNTRGGWATVRDFTVPDTLIAEVHDPSGELVVTLARILDRPLGQIGDSPSNYWLAPLFQSHAQVDALGSTIVLAHGSKPEVQVLDHELSLRTIIRWFEPDREVTRADVRAWREDYIDSRTQRFFAPWDKDDDATISQKRPVAEVFPVMSSVMVGRDGRIWIRRYDRPREDLGWLVFGADGEFNCHVDPLPGSAEEFGADYVLLLHEPDRGAETIRMYRLTGPDTSTGHTTSP